MLGAVFPSRGRCWSQFISWPPQTQYLAVHRLRAWPATGNSAEPWAAHLTWVATLQRPVGIGFIQYWYWFYSVLARPPWSGCTVSSAMGSGGWRGALPAWASPSWKPQRPLENSCLGIHTCTHMDTMLIQLETHTCSWTHGDRRITERPRGRQQCRSCYGQPP